MPTFSQLPSGKWRVQVRRSGIYRAATFAKKTEARIGLRGSNTRPITLRPATSRRSLKGATVGDLIDKYIEDHEKKKANGKPKLMGKTKTATLAMLEREIGRVKLASLNSMVLRDFKNRRQEASIRPVKAS